MKCALILLAGGLGQRFKANMPKIVLPLCGKPLARHSFDTFLQAADFEQTVVVCPEEYKEIFSSISQFAPPGERRQDSVENALSYIAPSIDYLVIHDAARPLIQLKDINKLLGLGIGCAAAALCGKVRSSLKKVEIDTSLDSQMLRVLKTLPRDSIREVYTPQMVERTLFEKGLKRIQENNIEITDDIAVLEWLGFRPLLIETNSMNFKVTYPEDLALAEALLLSKQKESRAALCP